MLSGFRSQHLHVQLQERRAEWQGNDNQNLRGSSAGGRGARLQHSSNAGRISSQQQERQDHTSCLQALAHLDPNGALVQDAVQVGCRVDAHVWCLATGAYQALGAQRPMENPQQASAIRKHVPFSMCGAMQSCSRCAPLMAMITSPSTSLQCRAGGGQRWHRHAQCWLPLLDQHALGPVAAA